MNVNARAFTRHRAQRLVTTQPVDRDRGFPSSGRHNRSYGSAMTTDSEFRVYPYIHDVLKKLGWDTRNPARGGEVYTQREFRKHDALLSHALGQRAPENIVLVPWASGHNYWTIEAKRSHSHSAKALREAQGYGTSINALQPDAARFATGIAGTPAQSFFVKTTYWDGSTWRDVAINNYSTTGFLTPEQCRTILAQNNPRILDYEVNLDLFLTKANDINRSLHANSVAARDRARLVAGLLLALAEDSAFRITVSPRTLVGDVNSRITSLLEKHRKQDFLSEVQLRLPANSENHRKYWSAIVETMQHLREMNIRSAINSGTDALGQFYETFLKYANDASEMGIVLTPRHVTRFAVDVLHIQHEHAVYDPTCGTGGFLVAALDAIRASHRSVHPDIYDRFRNDSLHGIEQADDVFGLALVNMIFRGDGKSRIHNGNCFDNIFVRHNGQILRLSADDTPPHGAVRPFARVLMNPPFALRDPEYRFVDHALEQMDAGGFLFAILPNTIINGLQTSERQWRQKTVACHTVRAVVRMPRPLFQPQADKVTYALILEAWRPHRADDLVFFALFHDHESASRLSKFVKRTELQDNVDRLTRELRGFMVGITEGVSERPAESGLRLLRLQDHYDFSPEAYLDNPPDSGPIPPEGLFVALARKTFRRPRVPASAPKDLQQYRLDSLFDISRGTSPSMKYLAPGDTPVVTTSEEDNGIAGYFDVPPEHIQKDAITISANGGGGQAFWHPYSFAASQDVLVCKWIARDSDGDVALSLYVCDAINRNSWRYSWARKSSPARLLSDVWIALPMKGGRVDREYIRRTMGRVPGFSAIMNLIREGR